MVGGSIGLYVSAWRWSSATGGTPRSVLGICTWSLTPKLALLRALWSLLDGIWGSLKASWGGPLGGF